MLKTLFTISFFLITQLLCGQVVMGTYVLKKDTVSFFKGTPFISYPPFPNLQIDKGQLFLYTSDYPTHCLRVTISGTWIAKDDTLYLKDSIRYYVGPGRKDSQILSLPIVSVYKIENELLLYLYTMTGNDQSNSSANDWSYLKYDLRLYKE